MKTIVLLLDGVADRPQAVLEGKTPLEAAHTPRLDALCQKGETGVMVPWQQGVPLGTEVAHFLLLGYDMKDFPGRGIINALSRDVQLEEDGVYLATSWATVEEKKEESGLRIKERWTNHLTIDEMEKLREALPGQIEDVQFSWIPSSGPHGVLHLKGPGISSAVSDADPFYMPGHVMSVEAYDTEEKEAFHTAGLINRFLQESYRKLQLHPVNRQRVAEGLSAANFLLTKWAGQKPDLETFKELNGMRGAMVAKGLLMYGIAKLVGMDFKRWYTFEEGVQMALENDSDFVWLHTKEPDEAAHTKDPLNKVKCLEAIDSKLGPLVTAVDKGKIMLVVTGDHTTPSSGKMIHSGESLPIMFVGGPVRVDDVSAFDERSCAKGSLRMTGSDLIPMVLNLTERALLHNFRQGGKKRRYIPWDITKFIP